MELLSEVIFHTLKKNKKKLLLADSTGMELSGEKLLILSIIFQELLKKDIQEQNIGLILPTTAVGTMVNLALMFDGRTLVNINYTMSYEAIKLSLEDGEIKTIITSKKFIKKLEAKGLHYHDLFDKYNTIYLEDLKAKISKYLLVKTFLSVKFLPSSYIQKKYIIKKDIDDTAIILFSSGSEGVPKGIELSYKNILGNIKQIQKLLYLQDDVMLGSLPLFHSFGFTVTTFMPLVEGILCVSHPDPTDGVEIAKLVEKYKATIMCATPTFLRLYTKDKKVKPEMLKSLKYTVAGAEKLQEVVKEEFENKFNKEIIEGYGTTETSPVVSCNIPKYLSKYFNYENGNIHGSVGVAIPETNIKIVDPKTLEVLATNNAGMVIVSGVQVMKGYYKNPKKTDEVVKIIEGKRYYITGDKGLIDENGFLKLIDRYSRFAKIGGEMVSLGSVEEKISLLLKNYENIDFAVTSIEDEKKGEKLILLISKLSSNDLVTIKHLLIENFENKLMLPHKIIEVEQIAKLGSGKKDFKGIKKQALENI